MSSSQCRTWIFIAIAALSTVALGQRGSNPGSSASRPSTPQRTQPTPTDNPVQPIFLSGKVVLEGGGVLAEPVAIERVCGGTARREGYTDFKGQYQLQIGGTSNMTFQDASESDLRSSISNMPRSSSAQRRPLDLNGCELRAVLAGFVSSSVALHTSGGDWSYEVPAIYLKRQGNATGTTVSLTSMAAPHDAMRAYEKAQKIRAEKPAEAEKQLNKAVEIYPQFATAWMLLGDIHRQRAQFDQARTDYGKAVAADSQFVNPVMGLALIDMQERKWDDAVQRTDQVLKMNAAAFPLVYFFSAVANYNVQKFEAAEENGKKFKALDTERTHPDVCRLLAGIYARKQDYAAAGRELRDYLTAVPNAPDAGSLAAEAKRFEDLSISAQKR
jgi:tetratricopeptide (TPR) repeat protein